MIMLSQSRFIFYYSNNKLNLFKPFFQLKTLDHHRHESNSNYRQHTPLSETPNKPSNVDHETQTHPQAQPLSKPSKPLMPTIIGISGLNNVEEEIAKQETQWNRIYLFPYILPASIICRAKLYQTILSITLVPTLGIFYLFDSVSESDLKFYTLFSVATCGTLYIFGSLFKRLIGSIYLSEDGNKLRIARLTFWGNRIDEELSVDDIVPLDDNNFRLDDYYTKLEKYSDNEFYFLSLKFGGIIDANAFEKVFFVATEDKKMNKKIFETQKHQQNVKSK